MRIEECHLYRVEGRDRSGRKSVKLYTVAPSRGTARWIAETWAAHKVDAFWPDVVFLPRDTIRTRTIPADGFLIAPMVEEGSL